MRIRYFRPGDEAAQIDVYNAAGASLPRFKPATLQEVQRRTRARDFLPAQRLFVEHHGRVVGYCNYSSNGRVSFPWTMPGHEGKGSPLFEVTLDAMKAAGIPKAFAAYRKDWPHIGDFFLREGFTLAREMINYAIDLIEMPTPSARASSSITSVRAEDLPTILGLEPNLLRVNTPEALHTHLFKNPHFGSEALFALRNRQGEMLAAGIMVTDPTFADPYAVDSDMPCFRCGAFGTEMMSVKRIKGMFSFVARQDANLNVLAMDLMGHAAFRLRDHDDVVALAAQAPSDVPKILAFYDRNFKRQGSFPVFEKTLP